MRRVGPCKRLRREGLFRTGASAPIEVEGLVYIDTVPPDIEAYPHYYYGDGYAYYVEGRRYHHGARGWGYYREEPPQLAHRRANVVREAAPAMRGERSDAERAPAAPRERPAVTTDPADASGAGNRATPRRRGGGAASLRRSRRAAKRARALKRRPSAEEGTEAKAT